MDENTNRTIELFKDDGIPASYEDRLTFFTNIAKSAVIGIKDPSHGLIVYQRAKELGIGWANAINHMAFINGKLGIDIHIVKAILSKPGSGITWEKIKDYEPVYEYTNGKAKFRSSELPKEAVVVTTLSDKVEEGKFGVVLLPTRVVEKNGVKTPVYEPIDYVTSYLFKRKKKHIDGTFIDVSSLGTFSWSDAILAQLPFDKKGELSPDSAWQKYRKLMIDHRAFTFGARDIASDLLLGCYELTELLDIEKKSYTIVDGEATVVN